MAQIVNYWASKDSCLEFNHFEIADRYVSRKDKENSIKIDQDSLRCDFLSFSRLNSWMDYLSDLYSTDPDYEHPDAGAVLSFVCGITLKVNYTSHGSGTGHGIFQTLPVKFNYQSAEQVFTNDPIFYPTLRQNMENGQPALLNIATVDDEGNKSRQHAIVCDGLRRFCMNGVPIMDGFHLNFGWGASSPDSIRHCWYILYPELDLPNRFNFMGHGVLNIHP
jgi:hypothetical protein